MLELLDQVKTGEVEIETPLDAVALLMVKMGVSEQEMIEVMEELPDNGDDVTQEMINKLMEKYGFEENEVTKTLLTASNVKK